MDHWVPDVPEGFDVELRRWRQGDVALDVPVAHVADLAAPLSPVSRDAAKVATARADRPRRAAVVQIFEEAAVVSQTCDIVRSPYDAARKKSRPYVIVAPVVRLTGNELEAAARLATPRYVPVPGIGMDAFADLDLCATVEKSVLVECVHRAGCPDVRAQRRFAAGCARHFTRFAFPDEFERVVRPLKKRILDKYKKPESAEGACMRDLAQIRAHASPEWDAPEYDVELIFLVNAAMLPAGSCPTCEPEEPSSQCVQFFGNGQPKLDKMAEFLRSLPVGSADSVYAWQKLGEAWCSLATPEGQVVTVTATVQSVDEFPISGAGWSEELDFYQLSPD